MLIHNFQFKITLPLNFNLERDILNLPKCNDNELEQNSSLSQFFFLPKLSTNFNALLAASFPVVLGDFGCDVTCQACRENSTASFPVVLGDFGCDVTCQACRENSPRTPCAIALGSKPPLVTWIARTCLGTRLRCW